MPFTKPLIAYLLYLGYTTTPDSDYSWKEAKKVDDYYIICGLTPGTNYYFRGSIYVGDQRYVSDIKSFTTTQKDISVSIESTTVDNNTATISGKVSGLEDCDYSSIALTIYYDHGPEISVPASKDGIDNVQELPFIAAPAFFVHAEISGP